MPRLVTLKAGVKPASLVILSAAANTAHELGISITVTSGNDSTHMTGSKHYTNAALDFRTKDMPKVTKTTFIATMAKRLGPDYQCILESEGKMNEHLHVERDPS